MKRLVVTITFQKEQEEEVEEAYMLLITQVLQAYIPRIVINQ